MNHLYPIGTFSVQFASGGSSLYYGPYLQGAIMVIIAAAVSALLGTGLVNHMKGERSRWRNIGIQVGLIAVTTFVYFTVVYRPPSVSAAASDLLSKQIVEDVKEVLVRAQLALGEELSSTRLKVIDEHMREVTMETRKGLYRFRESFSRAEPESTENWETAEKIINDIEFRVVMPFSDAVREDSVSMATVRGLQDQIKQIEEKLPSKRFQ
jgi:hypothetical protein